MQIVWHFVDFGSFVFTAFSACKHAVPNKEQQQKYDAGNAHGKVFHRIMIDFVKVFLNFGIVIILCLAHINLKISLLCVIGVKIIINIAKRIKSVSAQIVLAEPKAFICRCTLFECVYIINICVNDTVF